MNKTDEEKALFMRAVGASHAEWSTRTDGEETLSSLTLGPLPTNPVPGPAARMAAFHDRTVDAATKAAERQHAVMFAASSVRPNMSRSPVAPTAVPRAVAAKEAAKQRG